MSRLLQLLFWQIAIGLLLWVQTRAGKAAEIQPRIVGGGNANVATSGFVVKVQDRSGKFLCAGTLVNPRHVVTAAHCVDNTTASNLQVSGGVVRLNVRGTVGLVQTKFIPSDYDRGTLYNDIAVLRLEKDLTGPRITTVPLCTEPWTARTNVSVWGWGKTAENATDLSPRMQSVTVPLISKRRCLNRYAGVRTLAASHFCTSVAGHKGTCTGDDGDPVIYNNTLCGVASIVSSCGQNRPSVYTSVKTTMNFLRRSMNYNQNNYNYGYGGYDYGYGYGYGYDY